MNTLAKIGVVALAASMAAGCATVTYSSPGSLDGITVKGVDGKVGQAVLIDTSGYYMFWAIPLVSGDLRWNDEKKSIEGGTSFFSDQVGVEELQTALLKIAETRNCDLADVNYFDGDASYAGPSYGGAVGTCFGSSHMSVSAILVPRKVVYKKGK
jgi:hypothetical protein